MIGENTVEFTETVLTLAARYRFSVTSWGRTPKHNAQCSGEGNSRHQLFLAVDCVLDPGEDSVAFMADAKRAGLVAVDEKTHIHLQSP